VLDSALTLKMVAARNLLMYLPHRLWLSQIMKGSANLCLEDQKIFALISSDTEFDPPSGSETWETRSMEATLEGMPRLLELCDRFRAPATLFCEARLVEALPDEFRDLSRSHEIGCHSFNHEWLGIRPPPRLVPRRQELGVLSAQAKVRVFRHAKKSIENVIGKEIRSFKAPFNSIDHVSTLSLLEKAGFNSDSSLPCYNDVSFRHPMRPASCRHVSAADQWRQGEMRLIEVPFTVRPLPNFWHPFDTREEVMDMVGKRLRLALEFVELQCRIDSLSGRHFSVIHATSHPWEFSKAVPGGGDGKRNCKRLETFFDRLVAKRDVEFLTVSQFVNIWEREQCPLHASRLPG